MIQFTNEGEIDIRSISTFGISVKDGDNPIGYFGTGLKYAIAVLLRTGHRVTVMTGEKVVQFTTAVEEVRGKSFDLVTMAIDGGKAESIGFTTELGKGWDLWMAYREIACNCKDEGGSGSFESYMPDPESGWTKIIVQGDEFEQVFASSHRYILEDEPLITSGSLEVRGYANTGFFYRGVRVAELRAPSLYTYNELSKVDLTEDRTVKNPWQIQHRIACGVLKATDRRFIRNVVTAKDNTFEGSLDMHGWGVSPSKEFIDVVGECLSERMLKVNATAMNVWKDFTKKEVKPIEKAMTKVQERSMDRALDFCGRIGFPIRGSYPIKVVESLGDGVLGLADDRTIYIAERVFHLGGTKQLAATLIEEYLHLRHDWKDLTRELQNFLFEKLVSLGEEVQGEPL